MKISSILATLVVVLSITMFLNQGVFSQVRAQPQSNRVVTLPVKVVFVGINPEDVNASYIKWEGNLPTTTYGEVLEPQPGGTPTGVVYNISYSLTFAGNDFKTRLESYLKSIEQVANVTNPWFYYYSVEPNGYVSATNYYSFRSAFYDANKVENWLYSNQQELGGFPENGWTLMLLNLPELPSFDFKNYSGFLVNQRQFAPNGTGHYYSVIDRDTDLGYQWKTLGTFMTGWGGVHRFWFDDLSAGPSFWTWPEDIPLQIQLPDNKLDLHTPYGKTWFTEYLADYIFQATWNLVTPFFVYDPTYSQKYTFDIHIFDNRTDQEKQQVDIKSTVNTAQIKSAFQGLLPYSNIQVNLKFEDMSNYPGLQNVIDSNYKYTDSFTFGVSGQPLKYGIVDARPVYKYLRDNFGEFESSFHRDRNEFTVPVFAFAFSNDTLFTFTYKWIISQQETPSKALLGEALGDLAIVSLSQREFQYGSNVTPPEPGKGEGFTEVIIHESGHMLGLSHPHNFGPVGDFTLSVMGYYTHDYVFGQSDIDALQRAHVDQIYLEVQSSLEKLSASSADGIRNQLSEVDKDYAQMNYTSALNGVLKAEDSLRFSSLTGLGGGFSPLLYLIVGLVVGLVVAWLLFRWKPKSGMSVHTLTETAPTRIMFCPNCGSPVQNNVFCYRCGTKLPNPPT